MGESDNQVILDRLYNGVWIGDTRDFDVMDQVLSAAEFGHGRWCSCRSSW
jgi:hypothetical protein